MAKGAQKIERTIVQMLADHLSIDATAIKLGSRLADDLGMDSLLAIEFVFELEKEFRIRIPEADVGDVKVVEDLVKYIDKRLGVDRNEKSR